MDNSPPLEETQGLDEASRESIRNFIQEPDYLDSDDFQRREPQQKYPSRLGRLRSATRSRVSRLVSRPVVNKVARAAGRYGVRLVAREALTWEIPGVNIAGAVYETGRFGQEVADIVKTERALARSAKVAKKEAQPFYIKAEFARSWELGQAERAHNRLWKEAERGAAKGLWDFNPKEAPGVSDAYSRVQELRQPYVMEAMSKAANSHTGQQMELQRFREAATGAKVFECKYFVGSADEKYQYLLNQATERLGMSHFDRLHHPDRALRFDQFVAERLYIDGYKPAEIRAAIADKSPFINGTDTNRYLDTVTDQFNRSYPHSDLSNAQHNLRMWRMEQRLPADSRHTPKEWEAAQKAIARNAEFLAQHRLNGARQMLQHYRSNPEMRLTTKQEYQVEIARIHENSPHLQNYDIRTSAKMMMAGHEPKAIEAALNEASPFAQRAGYAQFQEGQYGSRVIGDAEVLFQREQSIRDISDNVNKLRTVDQIPARETRLDRLGLAHEQSQPSTNAQPSRSVDLNPSR